MLLLIKGLSIWDRTCVNIKMDTVIITVQSVSCLSSIFMSETECHHSALTPVYTSI